MIKQTLERLYFSWISLVLLSLLENTLSHIDLTMTAISDKVEKTVVRLPYFVYKNIFDLYGHIE